MSIIIDSQLSVQWKHSSLQQGSLIIITYLHVEVNVTSLMNYAVVVNRSRIIWCSMILMEYTHLLLKQKKM